MKLRNKNTWEIGINDAEQIEEKRFCIRSLKTGCVYVYDSLAKLNDEWEDYKPAEPLIKDEKIRKAVRAWAEANSLTHVQYRNEELGGRFNGYDFEYICFNPWTADNLKDYEEYTIAELCGEEECE